MTLNPSQSANPRKISWASCGSTWIFIFFPAQISSTLFCLQPTSCLKALEIVPVSKQWARTCLMSKGPNHVAFFFLPSLLERHEKQPCQAASLPVGMFCNVWARRCRAYKLRFKDKKKLTVGLSNGMLFVCVSR